MRHRLKRPGFVLAPDGQPKLGAQCVGLLDQLFLAAASGSLTRTTPCLRWRIATPVSHQVRLQSATRCTNAVLHPWLRERLSDILAALPSPGSSLDPAVTRAAWTVWQAGLTLPFTLPDDLPPLRLLLVWDNLTGHKTPDLVLWLCAQGVMPLYTPVGGSWLNMAESIQRVLKRRALDGQHPHSPAEIGSWFEQTAQRWNEQPTPFEWNGKRRQRRRSGGEPIHRLGGSGACTHKPLRRSRPTSASECHSSQQMTH